MRDPVCGCPITTDDLQAELRLVRRTAAEVRDRARATGTIPESTMDALRALNRREGRILARLGVES